MTGSLIVKAMTVYLLKKKKGRVYRSEQCFAALAAEQGLGAAVLTHDAAGAPVLEGADAPRISISDTKNFWACVMSEKTPVGIDIEEARQIKPNIARMLHKKEQEYISALEPGSSEWRGEFLAIWTRKESYMKYCGEGMKIGFDTFSVIGEDLSYAEKTSAKDHPEGYLTGFEAYGLTGALCTSETIDGTDIRTFEYDGLMPKPALEKATDLLAEKDYLQAALAAKLKALGYSAEEAEGAAAELKDRGYLDDERVALNYAGKAMEAGKGAARIKTELLQKGADKSVVEKVLAGLSENSEKNESERARAAVAGMRHDSEKDLARIGRRLASLGYPPHIIYDILGDLRKNTPDD